jgi:hypothetical protein
MPKRPPTTQMTRNSRSVLVPLYAVEQPLLDTIAVIIACILGLSILATFASLTFSVIGLVKAAHRRKSTVSFVKAVASRNVFFRPELYNDDAHKWARLHRLGFVGVFISIAMAAMSSIALSMMRH